MLSAVLLYIHRFFVTQMKLVRARTASASSSRTAHGNDWDSAAEEHAKKLVRRELERLRDSFEAAKRDGYEKFIMFLHYPPTSILEAESGFTEMAEEYRAEQVIYAHCHGESRFHDSLEGEHNGIRYSLVSGDYLRWKPHLVLV